MIIEELHINADEGYMLGEPDVCRDPFTEDVGELFRYSRREFGRCVSSVYVDTASGVKRVGWVFQKRRQYQDCDETYMHETWVTLYDELEREVVERRAFHEVGAVA